MQFEVTDKSLDFLGYRALRDLLGSVGHSSVGRHDTRDYAAGVEAGGAPKPYEFGDTMNLDAAATILNAVRSGWGGAPSPAPASRSSTRTSWSPRASTRAPAPPSSCSTAATA